MTAMVRTVYKNGGIPDKLDADVVNQVAGKLWQGIEQGYGQKLVSIDYDTPDFAMLASLRKNVWQFSSAKNYQQLRAMSDALIGPDGKLRSYAEFKRAVQPIVGDHATWLETEYRTAVASAQMAAKWTRIQQDKDLFPLLQFDAVIDDRTTELCSSLNGVIRPVDDPFWDQYYPPNHFNCRSTVRQLQQGEITPDDKISYPDLPAYFKTNLAKFGIAFPPGHPYYKGLPASVLGASFFLQPEADQYKTIFEAEGKGALKAHILTLLEKDTDLNNLIQAGKAMARRGDTVEILPRIHPKETGVRADLLPGVKENKNPDYRINGEYAELESPQSLKRRAVYNRIRSGSQQAGVVILQMPEKYNGELDKYIAAIVKSGSIKGLEKIIVYAADRITPFVK